MKTWLIFFSFGTLLAGCSEGNFSADNGNAQSRASQDKCVATESNDCSKIQKDNIETKLPGGQTDPRNNSNILQTETGGNVFINRSFASFYFSGNGPGSCSEDDIGCGLGAPACEAGSQDSMPNAIVGDCPETSFRGAKCHGNRRICKSLGKLPGERVAVDFQFFMNQACPAGWENAGPIPGQNHHKIGYRLNGWGYYTLCRKSIAISEVVNQVTKVVTDIRLDGAGRRLTTALPCAAGYEEVGVLTDCVNSAGVTPYGAPSCSGQVRVCKKFEIIK